jgi:hypothetical protein
VTPSLSSFPVPLTFSAVDLQPEATIQIALTAASEAPDVEALGDAIRSVASALSMGVCPAPSLGTTERPAIGLLPAEDRGSTYRHFMRVRDLHPGAYHLLLNVLAQSHYDIFPLKSADVRAFDGGDSLTFDDIGRAGLPAPPMLPFELHSFVDPPVVGETVFRIRFAASECSGFFSEVQKSLAAWDALVLLGGYAESFEEADLPILQRGTSERFADTIEHRVHVVTPSQAAVEGMLNLLCRVHGAISPIVELEIESLRE